MNKIKNMNDTESKNLKLVILHINDTQVRLLEKFFEKIGIYYYTVEDNVKRAILEQNGQLTLIEFGGENIKYPIIVDGQANFDVLELIDKDENWLEQQINLQGYNQIKEIYLGEYLSGELKLYGYTK